MWKQLSPVCSAPAGPAPGGKTARKKVDTAMAARTTTHLHSLLTIFSPPASVSPGEG
jgi:hypothetical protein